MNRSIGSLEDVCVWSCVWLRRYQPAPRRSLSNRALTIKIYSTVPLGYLLHLAHLRLAAGAHTPLAPLPCSASRTKVKTLSNRPAAAPWPPDALSRGSPASLLSMQSPPPPAATLSLNHLARCLGVRGRLGDDTRVRAARTRTHRRALPLFQHRTHEPTWRGGQEWEDEAMALLDALDRCREGK